LENNKEWSQAIAFKSDVETSKEEASEMKSVSKVESFTNQSKKW
jgi:hypothetical protein